MLIWQYNIVGNIKIHQYLKFEIEILKIVIVIAVLIVFLNSRASTRICFHANLTEAYCRQLSNTSTSQVWKRNIKPCESYSSFNQISEFTCITLTHMYACSRKMTSVLHLNTTCLFILKRFQHHILSFFLRTLAENWLNWFWSCFSGERLAHVPLFRSPEPLSDTHVTV